MDMTLAGTVALVTGASSGIGAATARQLAAAGAAVAVVARRTDRLEALASELRESGARVLVVTADVTARDEAARTVEQVVAALGRLDTLVNNAGVMLLGPVVDAPFDEWQRMIDLNVTALLVVHTRRATTPARSRRRQPAGSRRHRQHQLGRRA